MPFPSGRAAPRSLPWVWPALPPRRRRRCATATAICRGLRSGEERDPGPDGWAALPARGAGRADRVQPM